MALGAGKLESREFLLRPWRFKGVDLIWRMITEANRSEHWFVSMAATEKSRVSSVLGEIEGPRGWEACRAECCWSRASRRIDLARGSLEPRSRFRNARVAVARHEAHANATRALQGQRSISDYGACREEKTTTIIDNNKTTPVIAAGLKIARRNAPYAPVCLSHE